MHCLQVVHERELATTALFFFMANTLTGQQLTKVSAFFSWLNLSVI
jgi:hypothetical protein